MLGRGDYYKLILGLNHGWVIFIFYAARYHPVMFRCLDSGLPDLSEVSSGQPDDHHPDGGRRHDAGAVCSICRPANGDLLQVSTPYLNLGGYKTAGIDARADCRFDLGELGMRHSTSVMNPAAAQAGTLSYGNFDLFGPVNAGKEFQIRFSVDNLTDREPLIVGFAASMWVGGDKVLAKNVAGYFHSLGHGCSHVCPDRENLHNPGMAP